jgi:hypothetical protein
LLYFPSRVSWFCLSQHKTWDFLTYISHIAGTTGTDRYNQFIDPDGILVTFCLVGLKWQPLLPTPMSSCNHRHEPPCFAESDWVSLTGFICCAKERVKIGLYCFHIPLISWSNQHFWINVFIFSRIILT